MVMFERVRELALALPATEESTWFGTPSFKVRGKSFVRLREDGVLVVKTDRGHREALLQVRPETYFVTPHYEAHPYVLVGLEHADEAELADLLADGWFMSAPKRLAASFAVSTLERADRR
jgi:hypothetical protein